MMSTLAAAIFVGLMSAAPDAWARDDWGWERAARLSQAESRGPALQAAHKVIAQWPAISQNLARVLIQVYGEPDVVSDGQLLWSERQPWKKILVFKDSRSKRKPGLLLESVAYAMPEDKRRALSAFGHGVFYDPLRRELAARGDSEETIALALNLADEVIQGRRSAEDARAFYEQAVALSYAGKSSPYMRGLLFEPKKRSRGRHWTDDWTVTAMLGVGASAGA